MSRPSVALIAMPWATSTRPSLALSTLSASLRERDVSVDVVYPNLLLSSLIGAASYEFLSETPAYFGVAEHLFAIEVFSRDSLRSDAFIRSVARSTRDDATTPISHDGLLCLRNLIPEFIDLVAQEILTHQPEIVGLTCTFNQVMPSVALAKALKARRPSIHTVLGGACVHGDMGVTYSRIFQRYIDCVFLGEADQILPLYVDQLHDGHGTEHLTGLAIAGRKTPEGVPFQDLESLPTPDFTDYFSARTQLEQAGFRLADCHSLPFEASRGCWWGQKQHCVFCGLNTTGMVFRRKSVEKVVRELEELRNCYGIDEFMAADNILDFRAYRELLPRLTALRHRPRIFFELKANVSRDDVAALHAAGINWVQPGFESFSDHVLGLMKKGTSAMQNIAVLKWLSEFGIRTSYNLLVGFPGETADDYVDILYVLDKITHLPPPGAEAHIVQVQRFSPFHFARESFEIGTIRGAAYYQHLIPPSVANPEEYAYFFDRDIPSTAPLYEYLTELNAKLGAWCQSSLSMALDMAEEHLELKIGGARPRVRALTTLESATLIHADAPISIRRLRDLLRQLADEKTIQTTVRQLESAGLLFVRRDCALALVPFSKPVTSHGLRLWMSQMALPGPVAV